MAKIPASDVVIFYCGEPSFQDCLRSVQGQTLHPRRIHVVENVYPMARAFQQGLEEMTRIGSHTYVSVDADMILHPHCFETLAVNLEANQSTCHEVVGRLEDGIEGPVWGVRILQTEVIAKLGGFREIFGTEREINERAETAGWESLIIEDILGLHNPVYTAEAAFIRYWNKSNRLKGYYGVSEKTFRLWHNQLKILIMSYLNKKNLSAVPALAGHFCGILTESDGLVQDYSEETNSSEFKIYMELFARASEHPEGNGGHAAESGLLQCYRASFLHSGGCGTPESSFLQCRKETYRLKSLYGYSGQTFRVWLEGLNILILEYAKAQALPAIAALAGHFCGMVAEAESLEDDQEVKRSRDFLKYIEFFSHYADPLRDETANASA